MNVSERIEMLDEAERCLRKASELIASSVKGTECELRVRRTADSVDRIIGSAEDGGSISSLRKDIAVLSDPIWTEPFASVKNAGL